MHKSHKVKLIAGLLTAEKGLCNEAVGVLAAEYGFVDYRSEFIPFAYTRYYEKEMGRGLFRQFVSFRDLIEADALAGIKLKAMEVEREFFKADGSRRVNIDPGYIEGAKLVLATTKNYDHRIYLGKGIFAEITLHYRGSGFIPWEWTYPDYRTKKYIDIFNHIRAIYLGND